MKVVLFADLHPALVAFPIALISLAGVLELLALLNLAPQARLAARYNLLAAAIFAIFAYLSGSLAAEGVTKGEELIERAIGDHFLGAKISLFLLLPTVVFRVVGDSAEQGRRLFGSLYAFFLVGTIAALLYTAWLGGRLVFGHAVGVVVQALY